MITRVKIKILLLFNEADLGYFNFSVDNFVYFIRCDL
jgi:hypothetical protein